MSDEENVIHPSGVIRSETSDKTNYLLAYDGPMFERYAVHMTKGAVTHGERNWLKAHSAEDLKRFEEGAARHYHQWRKGYGDMDHAAALIFNVNGAELVKKKLSLGTAREEGPWRTVDPHRNDSDIPMWEYRQEQIRRRHG